MDRQQRFYGLDFNDHPAFNQDIQATGAIQLDSLVLGRNVNLPLEAQPAQMKLMTKACLIDRFKQPKTQRLVNLNSGADDPVR
jgi:hypothetical protein